MSIKTCRICQESFDPSGFYTRPKQPCKKCFSARWKAYRERNREKKQEYDRMRSRLPHRIEASRKRNGIYDRERKREWSLRYRANNAEKRIAHDMVCNAVAAGKLKAKPCERCGFALGVQAHHEDYSKPLEVVWLCTKCHGARHREINAERRAAREAA